MALLVDGLVSNLDEVIHVDSGLADVARAEGINIDHKLRLAQRDCELKIAQFVVNHGLEGRLGTHSNLPRLDRVVVSDGLKRWFCFHTLHLFYSDAYYRVLNDRYGKKLEHFGKLAVEAWDAYVDTGIRCVLNPIGQGTISGVEINYMPIEVGAYDVGLAWVGSSGNFGSLSETVTISVGTGEGFSVFPGKAPTGVIGYDIYVGVAGGPLSKQNDVPLQPEATYMAGSIVINPEAPSGPSQAVDFVIRKSRMFTRG